MTEDTPPKSSRWRWRWIIASVLLIVGSVAGWCSWPRRDARFVGKWSVASDHGVYQEWRFDADGIMHSRGVPNAMYTGEGEPSTDRWSTKGDLLYFGSPHPEWLEEIAIWCDSTCGFRLLGLQSMYRATWHDDGSVGLNDPETDVVWEILRRLPE